MDNLFYEKYLKYKAKYLALGGTGEDGKKIKSGGSVSEGSTEKTSSDEDTKANKASLSCSCKLLN